MSTIELREKLRLLSRAERQEMLLVLKELEGVEEVSSQDNVAAGDAPAGGAPHKLSFEEAMDYTFRDFDTALRKLAQ